MKKFIFAAVLAAISTSGALACDSKFQGLETNGGFEAIHQTKDFNERDQAKLASN